MRLKTAYEGYLNEIYPRHGVLFVDVIEDGRMVYYPLLEICDAEHSLKEGRFWNFDASVQDNPITIVHELILINAEAFRYGIEQIVEWIAENGVDKWSFHLGHQNRKRTLTMFFTSTHDAVLFRLSLQRV